MVDVKLRYFTPIDDASEVTVVNGGTAWTVDQLVYSDDSGTYLKLLAPPSGIAGTMSLLVTHKRTQESLYCQHQYFDSSLTAQMPGAECTDGDADLPKVAQFANCVTRGAVESPMVPIDIVVQGFPAVQSAADMAVTFGSEPGVVNSVSYDPETKLLSVQVVHLQLTANSADSCRTTARTMRSCCPIKTSSC